MKISPRGKGGFEKKVLREGKDAREENEGEGG